MAETKQNNVFPYASREFYHGNQKLLLGDLAADGSISNIIAGTGLVSVSAMESQNEINNFPADDIADHATISGAPLQTGSMVFMQLDPKMRLDFFGQEATTNGIGYGAGTTYPKKIVQYLSLGTVRGGEKAALVSVYPAMSVTGQPTKETSTDSTDSPEAIQWTANVQATGAEGYTTAKGTKSASFEYRVVGDEAVDWVVDFINGGGILKPDTQIPGTKA